MRAYPGGLRVSVRDEIDNDFLLDALRAVLYDTPDARAVPALRAQHRRDAPQHSSARAGRGRVFVNTGAGFYDHMLQQLAFHAGLDLRLEGVGDLETGDHHTVEDMMRTFGEAFDLALGDRKGLTRYGEARVPMDEALAHAVVDLSGRATAKISITPDEGMVTHAFESLVQTARITLHVTATGENAHHVAEGAFKAVGRALAQALDQERFARAIDQRFAVKPVVVVDYGAGNTRSVCAALTHLERESVVTNDPDAIRDAEYVVLPGVGSATSAMAHLNDDRRGRRALRQTIRRWRLPTLGICLGMQLAIDRSEEGGGVKGLAYWRATWCGCAKVECPRLGWSVVEPWGEAFYFAHSYAVRSPHEVASVDGVTVAVRHKSFLGVQFHPEKSGPGGPRVP